MAADKFPRSGVNGASCPVAETIAMLSGKWKPLMLHMLVTRPMHFEEIVRALSKVNRKVVNEQLAQLCADGLVARQTYDDGRRRVSYFLTDNGRTLAPILEQMLEWSQAAQQLQLYGREAPHQG